MSFGDSAGLTFIAKLHCRDETKKSRPLRLLKKDALGYIYITQPELKIFYGQLLVYGVPCLKSWNAFCNQEELELVWCYAASKFVCLSLEQRL